MAFNQPKQIIRTGLRSCAQVQFRHCLMRNNIGGFIADSGRLHAADIQRRVLQCFLIIAANSVRLCSRSSPSRAIAAAAQTEYALVLPQLTAASLVALWRQAGNQAAASPDLRDETGRTRSVGTPLAQALTQAMAPDVPAITALRTWLATRLNWRPPG